MYRSMSLQFLDGVNISSTIKNLGKIHFFFHLKINISIKIIIRFVINYY
jgi:hypothetical protein